MGLVTTNWGDGLVSKVLTVLSKVNAELESSAFL